ncbi:MAG: hypothetical protein OHK93_008298 [Ramalina farinacea]|uniref:NCT transcriptional regulatory complex subunit A n=1 Tax=Ramalina farinacea TaxID=258253 RepID=A0AA43QM62_9LECA|nr:hypothetical protein [Ramalina farinacea]
MPKRSQSQFDESQQQQDWLPHHPNQQPAAAATTKPGRKPKKPKVEEEVCEKPAPGVEEGIEVKTKFPVARIKRIMQADEDVGKVSQVTPTAVSKALELFIISLTLKASSVARDKSSRRVTASHLKQAVQGDEQLDFLEQIVSKVPDAPTASKVEKGGGKKSAVEEESSDEAYVEQAGKKGKKGVGTRKRSRRSGGGDDD